jgi:hypothetical protein
MATMTAQMLIGMAHPYDGGINPNYYMYLSENSVPRWTLIQENISSKYLEEKDQRIAQWIPTIENMLEDALLMIGIYIIKDESLINMAKQFFNGEIPRTAELYEDTTTKALEMMRFRMQKLEFPSKITLSIFSGSTIMNHLKKLENYQMDMEVCVPIYLRQYNVWNQLQEIRGELDYKSLC